MRQAAKLARKMLNGEDCTNGREYRAVLAAENVGEMESMASVRTLLKGTAPWKLLFDGQPAAMTVHGRALGFRMVTRAGATLHQNLIAPHQGYPWLVFLLLKTPSVAVRIYQDACFGCPGGYMDAWSISFCRQFPSVEKLQSQAARCVLVLVLIMLWIDTGTLESLHASVRRLILAVSCQAVLREFKDVQNAWMAQTTRRHDEHHSWYAPPSAAAPAPIRGKRGKKRKRKRSRVKRVDKKKRKPGHGGAWRAFLVCKLTKVGGSRGFKRNSEYSLAYAAISPAEKEILKASGRAATLVGRRKKNRSASSFGPRSRDIERQRMRDYCEGLQGLINSIDGEIDDLETLADIEHAAGSSMGALGAVNLRRRLRNTAIAREYTEDVRSLQAYAEGPGAEAVKRWKAAYFTVEAEVVAVPTEVGDAMFCATNAAKDQAAAADCVAYLARHSGGETAQHAKTDRAWEEFNAPLMCGECEDAREPTPEVRYCRLAGVHLCTPAGKILQALRESFHTNVLKALAPAHSDERSWLKEGMYSVICQGYNVGTAAAALIPEDADADMTVIFHVSFMQLSPWRPTWMLMGAADPPPGDLPARDGRMYCEVGSQGR